jgi:hypothetical protein
MEVCLFSQFFLCQPGLLAQVADVRPQTLPDFFDFSHTTGKQEAESLTIA